MDPKQRFSSRVSQYVLYRPGYPRETVALLLDQCGLRSGALIADIGSGTGLLARPFLEAGCRVIGVEPNLEMRAAGDQFLAGLAGFSSIAGSAEETGLASGSVDLISAGQAFHWFDPPRARVEFQRVLRPDGWVALVWNERRTDSSPFLRAYEAMLNRFGTDYAVVNHLNVEKDPEIIPRFFGGVYRQARLDNLQMFDFEGLKGRLMSSSYAPEEGHPDHAPMLIELRRIFDTYQVKDQVAFEYDTRIFFGQLQDAPGGSMAE